MKMSPQSKGRVRKEYQEDKDLGDLISEKDWLGCWHMLSGVINKKTVTILLTNMVSITKCEYLGKLFSLNLFAYLLNQKSNTQFTECGTSKLSAWNKDPNKEVFFLLSFLSFFSFFSFIYLCIHIYMYIV